MIFFWNHSHFFLFESIATRSTRFRCCCCVCWCSFTNAIIKTPKINATPSSTTNHNHKTTQKIWPSNTMKLSFPLLFLVVTTVVGTISVAAEPCNPNDGNGGEENYDMTKCNWCAEHGNGQGQCCDSIYHNSLGRDTSIFTSTSCVCPRRAADLSRPVGWNTSLYCVFCFVDFFFVSPALPGQYRCCLPTPHRIPPLISFALSLLLTSACLVCLRNHHHHHPAPNPNHNHHDNRNATDKRRHWLLLLWLRP